MSSPIVIAALYRFVRLDNFESLRQPLLQFMLDNQVRGTLLLATEGINGTVAGSNGERLFVNGNYRAGGTCTCS